MAAFRKIFPSYHWESDVFYVNQIVNLPVVVGKEEMGFIKGVPNEEAKKSDAAIMRWIEENMRQCSCLVLFIGEQTYRSYWVMRELQLALQLRKAMLSIYLTGMRGPHGKIQERDGIDPFQYHGLYTENEAVEAYVVCQYWWVLDNGSKNIGRWIEDACQRAGK